MATNQFQEYCKKNNINITVYISEVTARTAIDAAEVNKVPVSNIVKSILLKVDNDFLLYLVPGDKRVDLDFVKSIHKANEVRMANADEVKEKTGYSIGGVPPFGHTTFIPTFIYEGFDKEQELVAAGGFHNATFRISYKDLKAIIDKINS